ncbi:XdhC family protein [Geobacter sulfurreducens]|uniref:XdhC family protein n=1 Tax=Geobacter sulfurreducens TaxID=35554 RepID=UPI0001D8F2B4|nr:XdhC/CoxI family protein [Geobacter sulfurreducens]ADI83041.1 dehydrogenase molybdenum cofactor insertion protein [Geobacter sulfurreducens KN400]AJY69935.1 dehydrogenase [Geobacter sulfurreducens]QVW35476.1 XdhC family protein [Geobacter sulfurreducens]UTG92915.1 XdhC family protein [Geobacter sulfurreducens]
MTDLELYEEIARLARLGEPFALATVVASSGSSPRKAGAKMLIRGDGSALGTVGGGHVEQDTLAAARASLAEGAPRTLEFVLTEEHGYACGGSMSVFIEPQGRRPLLVMFGAGHVGRAVTALAHGCGFRVVVIDERPEYAVPALLPGADEIVCAPVDAAFARLTLDRESFAVIATPGHVHDFDAVRGCLATEVGFIGLLGSRRKREALMKALTEEGYEAVRQARVVTPVGLDIGAQTPEEIAVSIVGQLVKLRRQA